MGLSESATAKEIDRYQTGNQVSLIEIS